MTRPGDLDFHLFHEGKHPRIHDFLGAHPAREDGADGTRFTVWAPNAEQVSVVGDFEGWGRRPVELEMLRSSGGAPGWASGSESGVWSGFAPGVSAGARYKYRIRSRYGGYRVDKADPLAFRAEEPPATASVVWPLDFEWRDAAWMRERGQRNGLSAPISIYEVHLGSWMRVPEQGDRWLSYVEIAPRLADHVHRCGFTHVELLPIMEHPFYGSWGYQVTGYFAASARYGSPQELMGLIDYLHREGIGVILDWTPAHFPTDEHGLIYFDGTHLYEHADPRQGRHPDWGTAIFNYGRNEVRSFLLSSAAFWLERYHVDGLRVDAVASMLYLDYSRKAGEWIPNVHGGRENLEAIEFLRLFNEATYREHPDVLLIAEESTSWPMVSRPTYAGGLGFGAKWDMGWMHDTLAYFAQDPIHRRYYHHRLTFRGLYMASENFVLPLSHDEVVHGKGSLLGKMPGDDWQRFASLRLLLADMWAQPGKKLLFMGGELAQWREWNHDASLDWHLVADPGSRHAGVMRLVAALNQLYRAEPALHEGDVGEAGFEWIDANDAEASVYAFLRRGQRPGDVILFVMSCTPVPRYGYRVGVPFGGVWREILNTDAVELGGSGIGNFGAVEASAQGCHGRPASLVLTLPPLGALFFKGSDPGGPEVPGGPEAPGGPEVPQGTSRS